MQNILKKYLILICLVVLINACSMNKTTYNNFSKVQKQMTVEQVTKILGPPEDSLSLGFAGIGGTNLRWEDEIAKINVQFFNGKVVAKEYIKKKLR